MVLVNKGQILVTKINWEYKFNKDLRLIRWNKTNIDIQVHIFNDFKTNEKKIDLLKPTNKLPLPNEIKII